MANTANGETFTVLAAAFAKTGGDRNDNREDLTDTRRAKTEKMTAKKSGTWQNAKRLSISKGLSKSVLHLRLFAKSQNKMQSLKRCLFQGPLQN